MLQVLLAVEDLRISFASPSKALFLFLFLNHLQPPMNITLKLLAPVIGAVALSLISLPAAADVLASTNGKCPSNYTPYEKYGRTHCRTPEKKEAPSKKSSSPGSSSSSSSSGPATEDLKGLFAKPNATTRCPTGYITSRVDETQCGSRPDFTPPKTARKSGACPAGTVEEWGAYCTSKLADKSDEALDYLYGYHIADFNVVFLQLQYARMPTDKLGDWEPAVLVGLKAERAASGNPYKTRTQRDQEKDAPAQAAAQKASNDEAKAKDQARNDAMRSACAQQAAAGIRSDGCMQFASANAAAGGDQPNSAAPATAAAAVKEEAVKAFGGLLRGLVKP